MNEGTLREVLAAVTSLVAKVETQGYEMDALRQELGNGLPRVATQHGEGSVALHGMSMFGDARDASAGDVRSLAGAAPRLGSQSLCSADVKAGARGRQPWFCNRHSAGSTAVRSFADRLDP